MFRKSLLSKLARYSYLNIALFCFALNGLLANSTNVSFSDPHVISLVLECGNDSLQLCAGLNGLPGTWNTTNVCTQPANGFISNHNDTCYYYVPEQGFSGDDFVCLTVCDDANVCDTFHFEIYVEDCVQQIPCANLGYDLLTISVEDCNDQVKICNPFPLGEALLYDYTINGEPYAENIGICSYDTLYSYSLSSLPGAGMNGPYELASWIVDGNDFGGTFSDVFDLVDLMNMIDPLGFWELDLQTLNITSFNTSSDYGQMTIIQTASSDISILNKNSTTAPVGSSINVPIGLHEIILNHQTYDYCVDTFTAAIHCRIVKTDFDTIIVNQSNTVCVDTTNLPGSVVAINQTCIGCQSLNIIRNGNCIEYTGLAEGTENILIEVCDNFGFCDTVRQIVTIINENNLPVARIDTDTTEENTPIIIDLLSNDLMNGDFQSIFILIYPQNGTATIGTDFLVKYEPDKDFCGIDGFAYEICNENGCDTSTANISVRCRMPLVYNGFSPNEDGINDNFKIFEIERYPLNSLKIFNRWGNLVYEKKNYQNEWRGKSFEGNDLPDGTYFYLFEIEGDSQISGYVQINR